MLIFGSKQSKMMGRFLIEPDFNFSVVSSDNLSPRGKKKELFPFKLSGKSYGNKGRTLSAETEKQRLEWSTILNTTFEELNAKKHEPIMQGWLTKANTDYSIWAKRWVMIKSGQMRYYKQQKDQIPCGVLLLEEVSNSFISDLEEAKKSGCLVLETQNNGRTYVFHETTNSMREENINRWLESVQQVLLTQLPSNLSQGSIVNQSINLVSSNSASSSKHSSFFPSSSMRDSKISDKSQKFFLTSPIKEGILYKVKVNNTVQKTKSVRLVLTYNFLYYFPQVNSYSKYHTLQLSDCVVEEIPPEVSKTPFSFRVVNHLHPLHLSAEDEKEFFTWIELIKEAREQNMQETNSVTKVDGVKTNSYVDYNIEVKEEVEISQGETLAETKGFVIAVKAFWTSWNVTKTWKQILDLAVELSQSYPNYTYPEIMEEPLYLSEALEARFLVKSSSAPMNHGVLKFSANSSSFVVKKGGSVGKVYDDEYDVNFMSCFLRELLRTSTIAQDNRVLTFFDVNNIFAAVERGEIANLRYFLNCGYCLDVLSPKGLSPLSLALWKGNKVFAELLLSSGASLSFPNADGKTPAENFILNGGNLEMLKVLLIPTPKENTSLVASTEVEIPKSRINNPITESQATALHVAVEKGNLEVVQWLLSEGAQLIQDANQRTPLHVAVINAKMAALHLLLDFKYSEGNIFDKLELGDQGGFTPLLTAVWLNKEDFVKVLALKGARLDAEDVNRRSVAHLCVLRKNELLLAEVLELGAPLESKNKAGHTPLHLAISRNEATLSSILIGKGANLNAKTELEGQSIVHVAVSFNRPDLIQNTLRDVLQQNPAIIDSQDSEGRTPIHLSIELKFDAISKLLIKLKADPTLKDNKGQTVLHVAVAFDNISALRMFCLKGNLINSPNQNLQTPREFVQFHLTN
eukprot:TRINITY_DN2837_c0_g1_i1.p1 TRINITY_DN2837_c0_g1~~TRINITY_DN2837_c0_g1_i1.p1  ORF type:complete len:916 (-),score=349.29 TRINITY_DN2837_c0_g1_i1:263-3010(-)